jgi:hypothetical protein
MYKESVEPCFLLKLAAPILIKVLSVALVEINDGVPAHALPFAISSSGSRQQDDSVFRASAETSDIQSAALFNSLSAHHRVCFTG